LGQEKTRQAIDDGIYVGKSEPHPSQLRQINRPRPKLIGQDVKMADQRKRKRIWFFPGLPAILIFFLVSVPAEADVHLLDPVVVTATRSAVPASRTPANVTVLTAEDLQKLPVHDAAMALAHVPGVFMDFNGGLGSQATASIYGSEARHVAVFIDGVPLNMLANPMTDLSKIPISRVDRIEVYKGTASSVWGSALGGVINIVTKEPQTDRSVAGQASISYGDYQTSAAQARLEGGLGRTAYLISAEQTRSDGFDSQRDFHQDTAYFKINHELGPAARLSLAAGWDLAETEDPQLYRPGRWESAEIDRNYQSLSLTTQVNPRLDLSFNLRRLTLDSFIDFYYPDRPQENYFTYVEHTSGFSAQGRYRSAKETEDGHVLNFGLETDWGRYNFSLLGRDIDARNQDLWLSDDYNFGPWTFHLGMRWDDNQDFGSHCSPAAGIVYRLEKVPALIRFQASQGFSAPPLSYLYDPRTGNPDLGPEQGTTWQLGAEADLGPRLHLGINLFRADLEDMIYYHPALGYVVNLDEVRRSGLELTLRAALGRGLDLKLGGTWVDMENTRTGREIQDLPGRTYQVGLVHQFGRLTQSLNGRWVDYNSSQDDTEDKRLILDYLLRYEFLSWLTFKAAVYNLTNQTEYHWWYFPHPGRWFEAGLVFSF